MKELSFSKEKKRDDSKRDNIELPINGDIYFAYRPSTNSIALFYSAMGNSSVTRRLASVEEFLEKNLEPDAYRLIMKAVNEDALEYEELVELTESIIAEFAENPPTSSTGSSRSPRSTGDTSTATSRRPASTRASSRSRASAD